MASDGQMSKQTHTFKFAGKASHPKNALALIYDLEGFSKLFNQPDVQDYVPIFLNHISNAIGKCLFGGLDYWTNRPQKMTPLPIRVTHEKFMGDGALYVIHPKAGSTDFYGFEICDLCNRLWNL